MGLLINIRSASYTFTLFSVLVPYITFLILTSQNSADHLFTCSDGSGKYWCNKYIKANNMTIVDYDNVNSHYIVQYQTRVTHTCILHHVNDGYPIGYKLEGYYVYDNYEMCVPASHRNSYIKHKDFFHRQLIFGWIGFAVIVGSFIMIPVFIIIFIILLMIGGLLFCFIDDEKSGIFIECCIFLLGFPSDSELEASEQRFANKFLRLDDQENENNIEHQQTNISQNKKSSTNPEYNENISKYIIDNASAPPEFDIEMNTYNPIFQDKFLNIQEQLDKNKCIISPNENDFCIYCQDILNTKQMVALPCNHWYHADCLKFYMKQSEKEKYKCPLCFK